MAKDVSLPACLLMAADRSNRSSAWWTFLWKTAAERILKHHGREIGHQMDIPAGGCVCVCCYVKSSFKKYMKSADIASSPVHTRWNMQFWSTFIQSRTIPVSSLLVGGSEEQGRISLSHSVQIITLSMSHTLSKPFLFSSHGDKSHANPGV